MKAPSLLRTSLTAFGVFWGIPLAVLVGLAVCPLIVFFLVMPAIYEVKHWSDKPNGSNVEVRMTDLPEIRFHIPADYLAPAKDTNEVRVLTLHYGFPSMDSSALASGQSWWRKSGLIKSPLEDRNYQAVASLYDPNGDAVHPVVRGILEDQNRENLLVERYTTRLLSFKPSEVDLTTYRFKPPGIAWNDRFDGLLKRSEARRWEFIHIPLSRRDLFIQCFDTYAGLGLEPVCEVVTEMEIKGKKFSMRYTIEDYLIPYWKEYDQKLRALVNSFVT